MRNLDWPLRIGQASRDSHAVAVQAASQPDVFSPLCPYGLWVRRTEALQ
jgi:hypothetical protein